MINKNVILIKEDNRTILNIIYDKMQSSLQTDVDFHYQLAKLDEVVGCAFDDQVLLLDPAISLDEFCKSIYASDKTVIVHCDIYAYITQNEEMVFQQLKEIFKETQPKIRQLHPVMG